MNPPACKYVAGHTWELLLRCERCGFQIRVKDAVSSDTLQQVVHVCAKEKDHASIPGKSSSVHGKDR